MATISEPIAIIGMSCRFPHCENTEEFRKLLVEGREGVGPIPQDRLEKGILSQNYKYQTANFLTIPIDKFDAGFFGVSPKSAKFMDPQLRLLMEVVWEALEDSNTKPENVRGTNTGIFVGAWRKEYQNFAELSSEKDFFSVYMGHSMSARLSFFLQTTGPALDTDTACSSSMVAVDLACKSLKSGSTDLAIVGGVNLLVEPPEPTFLDIGFATCDDGKCKPFDAGADGYGIAEGCGVIVLKRLSNAFQNDDKILASIKGSAITQEGLSRSIGTPTVHSEALAMSLALKDANVNPKDVSYIEAHGTGTKVGDPIEVKAIAKVYGSTSRKNPLTIGTVKANFGHSESCSGITSIIKVVLALQNELIPKHIHFSELNPDIDLSAIPAILPLENLKWPKNPKVPRIAGASSYGISGTDVHVIIQDAPTPETNEDVCSLRINIDKPMSLMLISAKSANALEKYVESYKNYFEKTSEKFEDIAHTANVGRALFDHRLVICARDKGEALRSLNDGRCRQKHVINVGEDKPKICMLFPGQGSQYHGMARELYQISPVFQYHLDECIAILKEMNVDLKSVLWGDSASLKTYCQIAIVCVNYCLYKLWESWGVKPDYVLGHSLGESAAVMAIGIRDLRSGLEAIHLKSKLVQEFSIDGSMIALMTDKTRAKVLLLDFMSKERENSWLDLAAINSNEQTVLSGESRVIERFKMFCDENGEKSVIIDSSHAYHSRMMDPVLEGIRDGIAKIHGNMIRRHSPSLSHATRYISSSQGRLVGDDDLLNEEYWVHNTRSPVQFMDACKVAWDKGCRIFIEVGAHPILTYLIKSNCIRFGGNLDEVTCLFSLKRKENDWEQMLDNLALFALTCRGNEINWNGFEEPYGPKKKVSLPFHPFIRKQHWIHSAELMRSGKPKKTIHPLLGEKIENASEVKLFQREITLKENDLEYLKDHRIGEHIIFPGAGFLEQCIAAACNATKRDHNFEYFSIQDFKIESPVKLSSENQCVLQVIVKHSTDSKSYDIDIFSKTLDDASVSDWDRHCSCKCGPTDINADSFVNYSSSMDLMELQSELMDQENDIDKLYKIKLPTAGLNFGPRFQTMHKVWMSKDKKRAVVTINAGEIGISKISQYFTNPLVLDAMIQTTLILLPQNYLHIPVGIEKFAIVKTFEDLRHQRYFGYCMAHANKADMFHVYLLTESGNLLAIMEGLQMCRTSTTNIDKKLGIFESGLPQLWKEIWKMSPLAQKIATSNTENRDTWIIFGTSGQLPFQNKLIDMGRNGVFYCDLNCEVNNLKEKVFQFLNTRSDSLEGILYLTGSDGTANCQQTLCEPFLYICQWLQENTSSFSIKLVVVTRGTQFVIESDIVTNPNPATLWGIAKTLKNECPNILMKCIDLPSKSSINDGEADKICAEMIEDDDWKDDQISLRDDENGRYAAKLVSFDANESAKSEDANPLFKTRCSTYIVTGGLRGLGFKVASWMLENGAKHLILVGRSEPGQDVAESIKLWNESGKRVYAFKADVGNLTDCSELFDWIKESELPPVRGIMHCAGVLADAITMNQSWKNFEIVFGPKINGSWNLHKLSLFYKLDYFVMFSSISSQFGIPGQANYSAGNCFEDALARYRHSLHLPATVINWGNWDEVGMASKMSFPGLKPITVQQGLKALEYILRQGRSHITPVNVLSFHQFAKLCPRTVNYVDGKFLTKEIQNSIIEKPKLSTNTYNLDSKEFWEKFSVADQNARLKLIEKYVVMIVKHVLRMGEDEYLDNHEQLDRVGLDSLLNLEVHNELQKLFGKQAPISLELTKNYVSISVLSRNLLETLIKMN